jgi:iduronate 2-sulfatase
MRKTTLICVLVLTIFALQAQKQNVVFILVDDLKPTINVFGESQMKTPNFDSFIKESDISIIKIDNL